MTMLPSDMTLAGKTADGAADRAADRALAAPTRKGPGLMSAALRRLTLATVAGAVALSVMMGAPAPARADNTSDNVLKGLIALGAVGVLVNSLDKKDNRDRKPYYDNRRPPPAAWRDNRRYDGWDKGPSRSEHARSERDRDYRRNAWNNDRNDRRWDRNDRRWPGPSHDR